MVIRWISRLISERKRRDQLNTVCNALDISYGTTRVLASCIDSSVARINKFGSLMRLYHDEADEMYQYYKRQHDCAVNELERIKLECQKNNDRIELLKDEYNRLSRYKL